MFWKSYVSSCPYVHYNRCCLSNVPMKPLKLTCYDTVVWKNYVNKFLLNTNTSWSLNTPCMFHSKIFIGLLHNNEWSSD